MRHFIQIETVEKRRTTLYRFYGLGEWKMWSGKHWRAINAIHVPADVLKTAAAHCRPAPPILSETDVAALCGAAN